jgi:hypothetical protein
MDAWDAIMGKSQNFLEKLEDLEKQNEKLRDRVKELEGLLAVSEQQRRQAVEINKDLALKLERRKKQLREILRLS